MSIIHFEALGSSKIDEIWIRKVGIKVRYYVPYVSE